MTQQSFNKYEYSQAKAFLKANDAAVVSRTSSPVATETHYTVNGQRWYEYSSRLESPEDDYRLQLAEA